MRRLLVAAVGLLAGLSSLCSTVRPARADIFTYADKEGVVHFTNVTPPHGSKWKTLYKSGPGKALAVSGATSGSGGCKESRKDVVPARDRDPARYRRYDALIVDAARTYAIPEALVRAVIKVESDYDPNVVSCAGAKGLMQIMPYEETSQHIDHVFDPRENIFAGTRLLRLNANHFKGDLVRTIAAYHAGVGAVEKYGGVPPYQTTQDYVRMVTKAFAKYRDKAIAEASAAPPPG